MPYTQHLETEADGYLSLRQAWYRVSSRTTRATQRNLVWKTKQTKKITYFRVFVFKERELPAPWDRNNPQDRASVAARGSSSSVGGSGQPAPQNAESREGR